MSRHDTRCCAGHRLFVLVVDIDVVGYLATWGKGCGCGPLDYNTGTGQKGGRREEGGRTEKGGGRKERREHGREEEAHLPLKLHVYYTQSCFDIIIPFCTIIILVPYTQHNPLSCTCDKRQRMREPIAVVILTCT